nr:hypothetical protein CFP56_09030 [Quercus suber]
METANSQSILLHCVSPKGREAVSVRTRGACSLDASERDPKERETKERLLEMATDQPTKRQYTRALVDPRPATHADFGCGSKGHPASLCQRLSSVEVKAAIASDALLILAASSKTYTSPYWVFTSVVLWFGLYSKIDRSVLMEALPPRFSPTPAVLPVFPGASAAEEFIPLFSKRHFLLLLLFFLGGPERFPSPSQRLSTMSFPRTPPCLKTRGGFLLALPITASSPKKCSLSTWHTRGGKARGHFGLSRSWLEQVTPWRIYAVALAALLPWPLRRGVGRQSTGWRGERQTRTTMAPVPGSWREGVKRAASLKGQGCWTLGRPSGSAGSGRQASKLRTRPCVVDWEGGEMVENVCWQNGEGRRSRHLATRRALALILRPGLGCTHAFREAVLFFSGGAEVSALVGLEVAVELPARRPWMGELDPQNIVAPGGAVVSTSASPGCVALTPAAFMTRRVLRRRRYRCRVQSRSIFGETPCAVRDALYADQAQDMSCSSTAAELEAAKPSVVKREHPTSRGVLRHPGETNRGGGRDILYTEMLLAPAEAKSWRSRRLNIAACCQAGDGDDHAKQGHIVERDDQGRKRSLSRSKEVQGKEGGGGSACHRARDVDLAWLGRLRQHSSDQKAAIMVCTLLFRQKAAPMTANDVLRWKDGWARLGLFFLCVDLARTLPYLSSPLLARMMGRYGKVWWERHVMIRGQGRQPGLAPKPNPAFQDDAVRHLRRSANAADRCRVVPAVSSLDPTHGRDRGSLEPAVLMTALGCTTDASVETENRKHTALRG